MRGVTAINHERFRLRVKELEASLPRDDDKPPCHGFTDLFFEGAKWKRAYTHPVCRELCHVRRECLERAIRTDAALSTFQREQGAVLSGVWGGASHSVLRAMTIQTRRGQRPLMCRCGREVDVVAAADKDRIACDVCAPPTEGDQ